MFGKTGTTACKYRYWQSSISQGILFVQWSTEALENFAGKGERKKKLQQWQTMSLKSCQLTDLMEFGCVIWRSLTPNFSYDCDTLILETSDKPLSSSLLAEFRAAVGQILLLHTRHLWQLPGVTVLVIKYTLITWNVPQNMWCWIRLNPCRWEASR